ncbi:MAG: molecular chaperone HtpG, partial [Oscillospiraceae bacterium]|nr:molecular chaperone HtpG [Oscillospiraceae bacterium]
GVGFYSAFMVSDKVTVMSKAYGSDEAWQWESSGADGYTITPCDKATPGTNVIMHIKEDSEECDYSQYLDPAHLAELVRKYSDYIHFPIRMEMEHTREKERPADAGDDYKPEWETYTEWETLNSMVPLWQRPKNKVSAEEYNDFYKEKFGDWKDPLSVIHSSAEGMVSYKALLYIPSQAPYDFYTQTYEKGLQLYSSGVLIMDKCADLLPDYFRFVKGVVDSPDFSLNLSREMLQHDRQLKVIATNLEKKIKSELMDMQKNRREDYETFWTAFGHNIKYGVVSDYGAHRDVLTDLLMFWSSKEEKQVTLAEYQQRMPESQQYIYYVCADTVEKAAKLPQVERIRDAGYEILYLTEEVDEFVVNALGELDGKKFKAAADDDALPQTDEEKAALEKSAEENKDVLDFVKETLGDQVHDVRLSPILKSSPVCLTADGPVSLEMERYFQRTQQEGNDLKAERVLELNADSGAFAALCQAVEEDKEKAAKYAELLYDQALLMAELPLDDPAEYTRMVCSLMV